MPIFKILTNISLGRKKKSPKKIIRADKGSISHRVTFMELFKFQAMVIRDADAGNSLHLCFIFFF